MKKFGTGIPYDEATAKDCLERWTNRWNTHDPFSGYAMIETTSSRFIGIMILGHADRGKIERNMNKNN